MEKNERAILCILIAAYIAIHLLAIDKPFFGDEIAFRRITLETMLFGFPKPDILAHPPAFNSLLAVSFRTFGVSEASARLVPVVFGALSLLMVYLLGSLLFSGEAGLLAVFILVASKIFLSYTILVDMDGSAISFFLLLETYLLTKYLKRGGDRITLWKASIALGAGMLFKIGTVLVPFIALPLIDRRKWRDALMGLAGGILIFLVIYTLYFVQYPWGFWTGFMRPLSHFFGTASGGVREPLLKFLGVFFWNSSFPLVLIGAYSILHTIISGKDRNARFVACCAILVLAAYSLASHKMERYFTPAIPLAAVLAAGQLSAELKKNAFAILAAAAAGLAYFSLLGAYSLSWTNLFLHVLPLALIALLLRRWKSLILACVFGLYIGLSIFAVWTYVTHDYVINECDGVREAASYIKDNLGGREAFVDATIGFYMDENYRSPPDLEKGINDGRIKYYAQCKAWPNFAGKNVLDTVAETYASRGFYVKSIRIYEFP